MTTLKKEAGWIGNTSYAQPTGRGDYPGCTCLTFWSILTYNWYFTRNSHLMVIDVHYIPVLFGLFTKVVVMATNQMDPVEQADMQLVSRKIEAEMAIIRQERALAEEANNKAKDAFIQEEKRLADVGRKYEARVKHMRAEASEEEATLMKKVLNAGDPEVLFSTKTDAYKSGFVVGHNLIGVKE